MNGKSALILALTGLALVVALIVRNANKSDAPPAPTRASVAAGAAGAAGATATATATAPTKPEAPKPRARFVELGSDSCQSCKAMIPVLAELRATHPATLEVEFIDVWKHPEAAEPYKIRLIPSQVFFGPDGREIGRHEGFYPADAIRARFAELGHPLGAPATPAAAACDPATAPCEG